MFAEEITGNLNQTWKRLTQWYRRWFALTCAAGGDLPG
jgi:hypothetical protein